MEKNLPKNWVETEVGDISEIVRGITYNKLQAKPIKDNDDYLVLRGGNIQDGKITTETKDVVYVESSLVKEVQQIKKGDVVIVGSTGSKRLIGKAGIAKEDYKEISFGAFLMLIRPSELIEASLFDYYFISDNYRNVIRELAGGVNINNIRREYITGLKFPLPPLAEQQRIVAKLDGLFGHLDSLKQRLEHIPTLLRQFRQSVLTQAVTGKLTGEQYHKIKLKEAVKFIGGGTPSKSNSNYWGGLIPWASVKDFKSHRILHKTQDSITLEGLNNSSSKIAKKGELLLITRMSPGRTVMTNIDVAINQDLKIIRPLTDLNVMFLSYWFESNIPLIESLSTGTTVKGIRVDVLNNIKIPIPTLKEQTEIVKRVEALFDKADSIEAAYQNLKQQIDSLPQAILAKAFKGGLVPQLPTDGDAKELLKEITALRAFLEKERKSKKKKKVNA